MHSILRLGLATSNRKFKVTVGNKIETCFSLTHAQSRGRASRAREAAPGYTARLGGKWLLGFRLLCLCASQQKEEGYKEVTAPSCKDLSRNQALPTRIHPWNPGTRSLTSCKGSCDPVIFTRPPGGPTTKTQGERGQGKAVSNSDYPF